MSITPRPTQPAAASSTRSRTSPIPTGAGIHPTADDHRDQFRVARLEPGAATGESRGSMTAPDAPSTARPFALTALWIVLMTPLSLAGGALQEATPIPYEVFPLVMLGPAVAALICLLVVPGWFPADRARVSADRVRRGWIAASTAAIITAVGLAVLVPRGAQALPGGWPVALGVVGVVIGLFAGSWAEELGYRGVMYRALTAKLGPWPAVILNGMFFGLCHLQYFGSGFVPVVLFVGSAVFIEVMMAATWTGPWRLRVLLATLIHAAINIALQLGGARLDTTTTFAVFFGVTALGAVVSFVVGRALGVGDFTRSATERAVARA